MAFSRNTAIAHLRQDPEYDNLELETLDEGTLIMMAEVDVQFGPAIVTIVEIDDNGRAN